MEISLINFKERFHELLLRFLWRQWSALGVAGNATADDPWMIDPEALLLFSTVLARRDVRLFDEILDWLRTNGSWINLQRLSRLQKERELGDASILAAIANHLVRDSAHGKWIILTQKIQSDISPDLARPLFPGVPVPEAMDVEFLRRGWQRGPVEFRGLSLPPAPDQPANFLIKLRALFGRQSRAEIIAWLLAHESGHPAEMARELSYYPRSLQVVLNELVQSGHVSSVRSAREKHFAIRHEEWRFLLTWKSTAPPAFPQWIQWNVLFGVLRKLNDFLDKPGIETMSPSLQAIEIRRVFEGVPFVKSGLPASLTRMPAPSDAGFLENFLSDLESFLLW